MATDELRANWHDYEVVVRSFYRRFGRDSIESERLEEADTALGEVADLSERLTDSGVGLLEELRGDNEPHGEEEASGEEGARGGDRERITTLVLAAAAVDIAVACDVLLRHPDRVELQAQGLPVGEPEDGVERESPLVLLDEAARLYGMGDDADDGTDEPLPPVAGAQKNPNLTWLLQACEQAADRLIESAYDPASGFARGVLSAAGGPLAQLPASDLLARLATLKRAVGLLKRQVVKLITTGIHKMLGASVSTSGGLVHQAVYFIEGEARNALRAAMRSKVIELLARAAGRSAVAGDVTYAAGGLRVVEVQFVGGVENELNDLTREYADQMKWAGRIASAISYAAPLVSALAAPTAGGGPLLLVTINGVGVGFVVSTLRMKVTGRVLSREVHGVVTIVTRRVRRELGP
jgi:hypothetical protein